MMTVLLQAPSKLPVMARAAMMQGATLPDFWRFDALLVPYYWLFLAALVANALYPSVLLRSKSARVQRDAVAGCDAALDLTYFVTFFFATFGVLSWPKLLPLAPYEYVATLFPIVHVFGVARALEANAKRRVETAQASPQRNRRGSVSAAATQLPRRLSVGYAVGALGVIAAVLVYTATKELYPFNRDDPCRPCVCEGGALVRCEVPDELDVMTLILKDRGITDVQQGKFAASLMQLVVSHNEIRELSPDAFVSAENVWQLSLSHNRLSSVRGSSFNDNLEFLDLQNNNISTIEGELPHELSTLTLRNNRIATVPPGTKLRNLFLDDNAIRALPPGAFDGTPRLEHVWIGRNRVNCSSVPDRIACIEEHCRVRHWLGLLEISNGYCNPQRGYDTAQCAWDGGDCK